MIGADLAVDAALAVEGATATVADHAAVLTASGAAGEARARRAAHALAVLARPANGAIVACDLSAAAIAKIAAAVGPTRGGAGERVANAVGHALAVHTVLAGDAAAAILAAAAAVADSAAVFAGAGSARHPNARGAALAHVVLAGPTVRAIAARDRAATSVADLAAAVGTSCRRAGERRATGGGDAPAIHAGFAGVADPAIEAPTAAVADGATVLARTGAARKARATCTAHALMLLAAPSVLTVAAGELAATSVAQRAAAVAAAGWRTGQRGAAGGRNALVARTHLPGWTALTVQRVAASVADDATILAVSGSAGGGRTGRSALADMAVAHLAARAIATREGAAATIADGAAIAPASDLAGCERPGVAVLPTRAHVAYAGLAAWARTAVDGAAAVVPDEAAVLCTRRRASGSGAPHAAVAHRYAHFNREGKPRIATGVD